MMKICKNVDGKFYIGGEDGQYLYKETDMDKLPSEFQKSIQKHLEAGRGMGAGLTHDKKYFFSNIHGETLHKCFELDNTPSFELKPFHSLSFCYIRNMFRDKKPNCCLRICDDGTVKGTLFYRLDNTDNYQCKNLTDIEEMNEYFFNLNKKKVVLSFKYSLDCDMSSDDAEKKRIKDIEKEKVYLLYQEEEKNDIFNNDWKLENDKTYC